MRSLVGREEHENKQKKKGKALLIFMLGILVLSSVGYAFLSGPGGDEGSQDVSNDNLDGINQDIDGRWSAQYGNQELKFVYAPDYVKDVEVNISSGINDYYQQIVYVASDYEVVSDEITSTLGLYTSQIKPGCYGSCEKNLPEKNCSSLLIVWNQSASENKVYQDEKCVFIDGDLRSVDAFLYKIFGLK